MFENIAAQENDLMLAKMFGNNDVSSRLSAEPPADNDRRPFPVSRHWYSGQNCPFRTQPGLFSLLSCMLNIGHFPRIPIACRLKFKSVLIKGIINVWKSFRCWQLHNKVENEISFSLKRRYRSYTCSCWTGSKRHQDVIADAGKPLLSEVDSLFLILVPCLLSWRLHRCFGALVSLILAFSYLQARSRRWDRAQRALVLSNLPMKSCLHSFLTILH